MTLLFEWGARLQLATKAIALFSTTCAVVSQIQRLPAPHKLGSATKSQPDNKTDKMRSPRRDENSDQDS